MTSPLGERPGGPPLLATIEEAFRRGLPIPPDLWALACEAEAARRGLPIYGSFAAFAEAISPGLTAFEHVPRLLEVAERVLRGELRHVLVLIAPRYLKSEVFSRLLPAYYLLRYPTRTFALAAHAAPLAWELSERARENFVRAHGRLALETAAKERWQTGAQGEMWATGMGGRAMGRGFNLGVVDDPISPEHAFSSTRRETFVRWWEHTWLRAREPHAQMLFVMQRLSVDDPVDYLFRREMGEGGRRAVLHWHVVVMDEVHSLEPYGRWDGPQGLPPTCTLEPDPRPVGTLLAPSRFSAVEVAERQAQNPLVTAAQRQQRPLRPSGDFWRSLWFHTYEKLPAHAYNGGCDWDTAFTSDERNSATAWIRSYRGAGERDKFLIYIDAVGWEWREFPALVAWMRELAGPHYVEAKASGKSAVQALLTYGITASEVLVAGDKLARSSAVQPAVAAGRVYVREEVLAQLLYAEQQGLLRITAEALQQGGEGLDLNDAFVQALFRHLEIGTARRAVVFG